MHKDAIEARFPAFLELFKYDHMGSIYDLNSHFIWSCHIHYSHIVEYIIQLAKTYEMHNIERYTNVHDFIESIVRCKK